MKHANCPVALFAKNRTLGLTQVEIRWEYLPIFADFSFNGYLMFRKSYNVALRGKAFPCGFVQFHKRRTPACNSAGDFD